MITFKTVRFKNFGSFGNTFTEINLNKNNTTLVCGSNGNGKSFATARCGAIIYVDTKKITAVHRQPRGRA